MHDKRLTTRLTNYWEKIKKDSSAPQYAKVNQAVISDIWQNCMVLEVQPATGGKPVYKYVHCGEEIAKAVGQNLSGQSLTTDMRFFPGVNIVKRIDEVFKQAPAPIYDEGQFVNKSGKVVKYRACLLTFITNSNYVSHVLVGVSWRSF